MASCEISGGESGVQMINTDCVEIKDWGHIEDHVEYQTSIQVSNEVWKQVWGYLYSLIRYEVRHKVWYD